MNHFDRLVAILRESSATEGDDFHVYAEQNAITVKSAGDENDVTLFKFTFDNEVLTNVKTLPADGNIDRQ